MKKTFTDYQSKKAFYNNLLTIYGRKPVLEALQDTRLNIHKIHLATSNKLGGIISEITTCAEQRTIEIQWHSRNELSRISRNSKQDQGVAADINVSQHQTLEAFLNNQHSKKQTFKLIALDRITNPQNLGMIIRSVCAGFVDGLVLPSKGCTPISPLVIKASVGTVFKCPILRCEQLTTGLEHIKQHGGLVYTLSSHAKHSLFDHCPQGSRVYVLGNETQGVEQSVEQLSDAQLAIPMNNAVESLNVAVTAALIAFHKTNVKTTNRGDQK